MSQIFEVINHELVESRGNKHFLPKQGDFIRIELGENCKQKTVIIGDNGRVNTKICLFDLVVLSNGSLQYIFQLRPFDSEFGKLFLLRMEHLWEFPTAPEYNRVYSHRPAS